VKWRDRRDLQLQALKACRERGGVRNLGLLSWLEELDWIAVGIFDLDLSADGTSLHLIAKLHARVLQRVDLRRQIRHAQDDSIPSARLLGLAAGHRKGEQGLQ
jgi:hypothetical protein